MEYLSASQTAEHWGISRRRVQILCSQGRIPGAFKVGKVWVVPNDAPKPKDIRFKKNREK